MWLEVPVLGAVSGATLREQCVHLHGVGVNVHWGAQGKGLKNESGSEARLVVDAYSVRTRPSNSNDSAQQFATETAPFVPTQAGREGDAVFISKDASKLCGTSVRRWLGGCVMRLVPRRRSKGIENGGVFKMMRGPHAGTANRESMITRMCKAAVAIQRDGCWGFQFTMSGEDNIVEVGGGVVQQGHNLVCREVG